MIRLRIATSANFECIFLYILISKHFSLPESGACFTYLWQLNQKYYKLTLSDFSFSDVEIFCTMYSISTDLKLVIAVFSHLQNIANSTLSSFNHNQYITTKSLATKCQSKLKFFGHLVLILRSWPLQTLIRNWSICHWILLITCASSPRRCRYRL